MILRNKLSLEDFRLVVLEDKKLEISEELWNKVEKSNETLNKLLSNKKTYYGINTGFGKLFDKKISKEEINKLQENLILSHSSGVGKDLSPEVVKGAMLLRINCFLRGHSGVRREIVEIIQNFINKNIIPAVPEKGSVGASGDLAPSAHLALSLLGRGDVYHRGKKMPSGKVLEQEGIRKINLKAKEGLSLINGTQFMTSIAAIILVKMIKLVDYADSIASASIECISGCRTPYYEEIQKLKPYKGQIKSGRNILDYLKDSKSSSGSRIQDPYSFRCSPQVHGAVREIVSFAKRMLDIEMNSVTDNPLIIDNNILSGGNFHGESVAFVIDFMKIGLSELSSISERRISHLMNPEITGLNTFLAENPGLDSGYMIPSTTAAALVSRNRNLSTPSSVDSIPTSLDQEDHVSMGMNGALSLMEIYENTVNVLAIELISAAQGIRKKSIENISPKLKSFLEPVFLTISPYDMDREHYKDIEKVKNLIIKRVL